MQLSKSMFKSSRVFSSIFYVSILLYENRKCFTVQTDIIQIHILYNVVKLANCGLQCPIAPFCRIRLGMMRTTKFYEPCNYPQIDLQVVLSIFFYFLCFYSTTYMKIGTVLQLLQRRLGNSPSVSRSAIVSVPREVQEFRHLAKLWKAFPRNSPAIIEMPAINHETWLEVGGGCLRPKQLLGGGAEGRHLQRAALETQYEPAMLPDWPSSSPAAQLSWTRDSFRPEIIDG